MTESRATWRSRAGLLVVRAIRTDRFQGVIACPWVGKGRQVTWHLLPSPASMFGLPVSPIGLRRTACFQSRRGAALWQKPRITPYVGLCRLTIEWCPWPWHRLDFEGSGEYALPFRGNGDTISTCAIVVCLETGCANIESALRRSVGHESGGSRRRQDALGAHYGRHEPAGIRLPWACRHGLGRAVG